MAYCILWEFRPNPEAQAQFEATYGPDGAWARLFRRSEQFLGTELLRDCGDSRRYLTLDRWTSRAAYEEFRLLHRSDYEELDRRCETLSSEEVPLGSHETVDP